MKHLKGELILLITAIIWGTSFISQKLGMNYVEPFTFGASRFLLGALFLFFVSKLFDWLNERNRAKQGLAKLPKTDVKTLAISGLLCGVALFLGASFQQWGIVETTAGKAGFITALYIVIVPLLGLFMKKRVGWLTWLGIGVAVVGLYLLCVTEGFTIQRGDAIVLIGTLFWALQIVFVDLYVDRVDGLKLSCAQFVVAGILSAVSAFIFETPKLEQIIACGGLLLYMAVVVVGVAYTLQIIGQKTTPPAIAAILLSLESVFAVISGAIFLGESMNQRELFGCFLVFAAVIMTQVKLPERN